MLQGRADLFLQIFFPRFENDFEADFRLFSRVGVGAHGAFTSRPSLEKSDLKPLFDFKKKIPWQKPTLSYNFSLGPKGV
jgi:hypothetical protein